MSNIYQLKRRAAAGTAGAPSALKSGELAWNFADNIIYGGFGDDGNGNATSIVPVASFGAFVGLTTNQTLAGTKTFSSSPVIPDVAANDNSGKGANTKYVDAAVSGKASTANSLDQFAAPVADVGWNSHKITSLLDPTSNQDAATKHYVDTRTINNLVAPTANVSWNSQKITNLADPIANQDAATKAYVDATAQGLDIKQSVRSATTANIALSGTQTIDGVALVAGDRVLVKNQTTGADNGIYVVAAGAWARAVDANSSADVTSGMFCFVEEGSANAGAQFVLSTINPITLGTTPLSFQQFGGGASYTAAGGIKLTGSAFSVEAGTGLNQDADGLSIDVAWPGQTAITTLGTITTGAWNATVIAMAYGGTGIDMTALTNGVLLKKTSSGVAAAVAGTDYLDPSSTIDGGTF